MMRKLFMEGPLKDLPYEGEVTFLKNMHRIVTYSMEILQKSIESVYLLYARQNPTNFFHRTSVQC